MSEENKALAHRFYETVFNAGAVDRVEEFCTPDYIEHEDLPGTPDGIEGVRAFVQMFRDGFPDIQARVQDTIAEGDKIVARVTFTGTHQGEFMGVPASGNRIDMQVIDIVRIEDGKAAEHWGVTDTMALMQQIGAVPADAPA